MKRILSRILPFFFKAELLRLKRAIENLPLRNRFARDKGNEADFDYIMAERYSPLERVKGAVEADLQRGKEANVRIAAPLIDGIVIRPGEVFSYHHLVGRPSRIRGFKNGLQLFEDEEAAGIGGGLCQVSNMLYWLAINSGMLIVERHRHELDLFPDHKRTAPFGCGATVFYNYNDLRFENPLPYEVLVGMEIIDHQLRGRLYVWQDPGFYIVIEERDHRFFEENGQRMRENKIFRIIRSRDESLMREELLASNRCRVKY